MAVFGVAAALLAAIPLQAQVTSTTGANGVVTTTTNTATPPATFTIAGGLQELGQAIETSTNWAVFTGYGHSINGIGRNLAFLDVGYDFNDYVGAVVGYDYLWGNGGHELNGVKGGLTLQLPMHPFAFLGTSFLTNLVARPLVFDYVATPQGGSTVANIAGAGVDFNVYSWGNLEIHAGVDYETRTGDGAWDGNYVAGHLAISRNF